MIQSPEAGANTDDKEDTLAGDTIDAQALSALVTETIQAVHDHRVAQRNALLRGHGAVLTDRERSTITNMMHALISDIGETFRHVLALRRDDAHAVAETAIASLERNWAIEIRARLAKSGVLGDLDLIAAAAHRTAESLLEDAPGGGPRDPAQGSRRGDDAALFGIEAITGDLRLAKSLTDYLIEKPGRFDSYQNPKLPLQELPHDLSTRLFWACSAAWREMLLERSPVDETDLDDLLENVVATTIERTVAETHCLGRADQVAGALLDAGLLTGAMMAQLLNDGEIALFEAAMARLLDLPSQFLRTMTFEPGGVRLTIAARAAGLTPGEFDGIARVIGRATGPHDRIQPTPANLFERIDPDDADRLVRGWRRQPGYLAAIDRLGGRGETAD